jgi:hypothetical protein
MAKTEELIHLQTFHMEDGAYVGGASYCGLPVDTGPDWMRGNMRRATCMECYRRFVRSDPAPVKKSNKRK